MDDVTYSATANKPLAIMAVDVKAQAPALRKNISDYPQIGRAHV